MPDGADTKNLLELLTQHTADPEDRLYEIVNTIENIVSSYDDELDAFAEMVQNALDALAARYETDNSISPHLTVKVNVDDRTLTVIDNGTGISWQNHRAAVRPNYSLKRRLGQTNSRGEKGAALAFLQFGHAQFSMSTRVAEDDAWTYVISDGHDWFQSTSKLLEDGRPYQEKELEFPDPNFDLAQESDLTERGTRATVKYSDNRLEEIFTNDGKVAAKRLEYILRTRTGVGFMVPGNDKSTLPEWQQKLKVTAEIHGNAEDLATGFLGPDELARRNGPRKADVLTGNSQGNELLYCVFDKQWIMAHLTRLAGRADLMQVVDRYEVTGYVSYAQNNSWYEDVTQSHLELIEDSDASLSEKLIQINGGFLVAVRDFPTGRRKTFLHRSGAEHKSRTFVVLNLKGDYKPDYGRKNLGSGAHELTLELCKELISFAIGKRDRLEKSQAQSTHAAMSIADARSALNVDAANLRERGVLLVSGEGALRRPPTSEVEVVAEFLRLVANDELPGFTVFGLLARGILDGYFDYSPESSIAGFDETDRPLGLAFPGGNPRNFAGQWLEFKVHSDSLITDFKRGVGEPSKKYFGLVDLLVCESIDTATDDFEIIDVTGENYNERKFFGVTHLLRYAGNSEHQVQVICLKTLRDQHGLGGPSPDFTPETV